MKVVVAGVIALLLGSYGPAWSQRFASLQECEQALATQHADLMTAQDSLRTCMQQEARIGKARQCNTIGYRMQVTMKAWSQCDSEEQDICTAGQEKLAIQAECQSLRASELRHQKELRRMREIVEKAERTQTQVQTAMDLGTNTRRSLIDLVRRGESKAARSIMASAMNTDIDNAVDAAMRRIFPSWTASGPAALAARDQLALSDMWHRVFGNAMSRRPDPVVGSIQDIFYQMLRTQTEGLISATADAAAIYEEFTAEWGEYETRLGEDDAEQLAAQTPVPPAPAPPAPVVVQPQPQQPLQKYTHVDQCTKAYFEETIPYETWRYVCSWYKNPSFIKRW